MSVGEKKNAALSRVLKNLPVPQRGGDPPTIHEPEGFTFIGLMVAIALINISLAVALTSWATINKRAKETELIWRGQQYVRALRCHQAQTGALPDELDELLESDCIRAVYPDPMSPDGEWRIIRESDLEFTPGGTGFGGTRSAGAILERIDREVRGPEAFFGNAGAQARPAQARPAEARPAEARPAEARPVEGRGTQTELLEAASLRLRNLSQRLSQSFSSGSGNRIVGVASNSTDEALRLYEGEMTYDAWRFVAR